MGLEKSLSLGLFVGGVGGVGGVGVGVGGGVDSETLETFRNLSCMCIWFMTHTP